MRKVGFFDWELRPTVTSLVSGKIGSWAVLALGEGWTKVSIDEVWDSGRPLASAEAMRAMFDDWGLPPLPMDLDKASPEEPLESSSE